MQITCQYLDYKLFSKHLISVKILGLEFRPFIAIKPNKLATIYLADVELILISSRHLESKKESPGKSIRTKINTPALSSGGVFISKGYCFLN